MNKSLLVLALVTVVGLSACDRPSVVAVPGSPAVVTVPASPVVVPGPAGPAGPTGSTGSTGATGATGQPGDGTTIIVTPPASAPAN